MKNYMGAFSFASSTSNPLLNTNDGFANALLGNVNSYSQYNNTRHLTSSTGTRSNMCRTTGK